MVAVLRALSGRHRTATARQGGWSSRDRVLAAALCGEAFWDRTGSRRAFVGELMTPGGHQVTNEGDFLINGPGAAPYGRTGCASLEAASQSRLLTASPRAARLADDHCPALHTLVEAPGQRRFRGAAARSRSGRPPAARLGGRRF